MYSLVVSYVASRLKPGTPLFLVGDATDKASILDFLCHESASKELRAIISGVIIAVPAHDDCTRGSVMDSALCHSEIERDTMKPHSCGNNNIPLMILDLENSELNRTMHLYRSNPYAIIVHAGTKNSQVAAQSPFDLSVEAREAWVSRTTVHFVDAILRLQNTLFDGSFIGLAPSDEGTKRRQTLRSRL